MILELVILSLNTEYQKIEKEIKLDIQIPIINKVLDILYTVFKHRSKEQ
jgi:hypothetical protein